MRLIGAFLTFIFSSSLAWASDDFAEATRLEGASATGSVDTSSFTVETGEPFVDQDDRTGWFIWTAPASGTVSVDTGGSSGTRKSVRIYIARTPSSPAVTSLARVVSASGDLPRVSFPVSTGTIYYFQVLNQFSNQVGPITLNIILDENTSIGDLNLVTPTIFANDRLAEAVPLTGMRQSAISYFADASVDTNDIGPDPGVSTTWFTYRAEENGILRLRSTLSSVDGVRFNLFYLNPDGTRSRVAFGTDSLDANVVNGGRYQISTGAQFERDLGWIVTSLDLDQNTPFSRLNIQAPATTSNQLFSEAIEIEGTNTTVVGYNRDAEDSEPFQPEEAGNRVLWWTWTAPASGMAAITLNQSLTFGNSMRLVAWTGPTLSQLESIASELDETPSLTFEVLAGQTYHLSAGFRFEDRVSNGVALTLQGPPNTGNGLRIDAEIETAVRLAWFGVQGESYSIQELDDQGAYQTIARDILGQGEPAEFFAPVTSRARIFRVTRQ